MKPKEHTGILNRKRWTSLPHLLLTFAALALGPQISNAARIISLSGDLEFGEVEAGTTSQRTFTIFNEGSQNLVVQSIDYPPGFSGDFLSGPIKPGKSQVVTVTFAPTSATSYGGTLFVNCNNTSGDNTLPISGSGTPPPTRIISLGGDVNFGDVTVGSSAQKTLFITNSGNSALTVSGISYPDGFSGPFSGSIPAGAVQEVEVTFAPVNEGAHSGTLVVSSDATSGNGSRFISGNATPIPTRIISVSGDLDFGDVLVHTTAQLVFSITNSGNSTLTISDVSYPERFSGNFSSGSIEPGAVRNVIVTFSPDAQLLFGGTIVIDSDATSGIHSLNVSGTGTNLPPGTILISIGGGNLNFGDVQVGSSADQTFFITNAGNATMTVTGIEYPEGFMGNFSAGSIEAGAVQSVTVTFAPDAATDFGGTVTVQSDAANSDNALLVSGTGFHHVPSKARFSGLFYPESDVEYENSGWVRLSTSTKDRFTAKLRIGGVQHSFSGQFSESGTILAVVQRDGLEPLTIELQAGYEEGNLIKGTVSDGTWTANLLADRSVYHKVKNPAPQAGTYNLTIAGCPDELLAPESEGVATVTVRPSGLVKISGTLGDGTRVSRSSVVAAPGSSPLYAPLYSKKGAILGWLNFSDQPGQEVSAVLDWFKLPQPDSASFPAGFTFQTTAEGWKH